MYIVIRFDNKKDEKPHIFGPFKTKKRAARFIKKRKYSKPVVRTMRLIPAK